MHNAPMTIEEIDAEIAKHSKVVHALREYKEAITKARDLWAHIDKSFGSNGSLELKIQKRDALQQLLLAIPRDTKFTLREAIRITRCSNEHTCTVLTNNSKHFKRTAIGHYLRIA